MIRVSLLLWPSNLSEQRKNAFGKKLKKQMGVGFGQVPNYQQVTVGSGMGSESSMPTGFSSLSTPQKGKKLAMIATTHPVSGLITSSLGLGVTTCSTVSKKVG
jgi:hypothetical protein